ncbi:uncharacterized protein LOC134696236 [Mytilus trossulus]|uniref:uncharacterized protein LOC134696236 n=1 Tax=Mytilus trossulus TaxID=6551 RepID=UPI00300778F6
MTLYCVNDSFSSKIQDAILSVCSENYSSQGIEVDGIVCVTFRNPATNCVVRIHKSLGKEPNKVQEPKSCLNYYQEENLDKQVTQSTIDNNRLDAQNKNNEQMYLYEHGEENDLHFSSEHDDHGERMHLIARFPRSHGQYFESNQTNNSEKERFQDIISPYSNSETLTKSEKPSSSNACNIGKDNHMIKIEKEDWNGPEKSSIINKKSNLETIINRFTSENNAIIRDTLDTDEEHMDQGQHFESDNEMYFVENDNQESNMIYYEDESESDSSRTAKYGNPVCIDLSETDPDLVEVQSEIESRLKEEMNRTHAKFKIYDNVQTSFETNITNSTPCTSQQTKPTFKLENVNRTNTKSLSQIKQSLKGSFAKSRYRQLGNKPMPVLSFEQKKVYCKFCGLGFTNSGNKNRHERSTCGAVKYKCEFCDSLFSRSDSRARHMLYCHGLAIKDRLSNISPKKSGALPKNIKLGLSTALVTESLPNFKNFSDPEIHFKSKDIQNSDSLLVVE